MSELRDNLKEKVETDNEKSEKVTPPDEKNKKPAVILDNKNKDIPNSDKCIEKKADENQEVKEKRNEEDDDDENDVDKVVYKRFKFLKHALDKVFTKCSSAGKFSWYQTHFPTLNKVKPTELKHIQEQVIQQLGENIRIEAKLMLAEENIEQMLNDLDVLIHKAPAPKDSVVWRPTGIVKDDVRAHLMPEKTRFCDSLQELLKKLEQENKQLKDVVAHRNKMIVRTKKKLDEHTAFFKKVIDTTDKVQKSLSSNEI